MTKTVLYIGWVGFGNLGDDLCFDIFSETMSERAAEKGLRLEIKGLFPPASASFPWPAWLRIWWCLEPVPCLNRST